MIPVFLFGYKPNNSLRVETYFRCSNDDCLKGFIAYFPMKAIQDTSINFESTSIGNQQTVLYTSIIKNISSKFEEIYNEAYFAEQHGLTQICGVGYRKALEFLIKDYVIKNNPGEEDKVKKMLLMNVVATYIKDDRIKDNVERAVWLGNDETHYTRLWTDHDLEDLKELIDLSVSSIEADEKSKAYKLRMNKAVKVESR